MIENGGDKLGMSEEDLVSALQGEIQSAAEFVETELAPARVEATRFYKGEAFGDEDE
jgi:hypothetical protein